MIRDVLSLPLRAIWFLIKGQLFPWYIKLVFRLPWWVFGGLAASMVFLSIDESTGAAQRQQTFEIAMTTRPQAVTPLADFVAAQDITTFGEVLISGKYKSAAPIRDWEASGPDFSYVPMFLCSYVPMFLCLMIGLKRWALLCWSLNFKKNASLSGCKGKVEVQRKRGTAMSMWAGWSTITCIGLKFWQHCVLKDTPPRRMRQLLNHLCLAG